jgi:hypothetical protein
MSFYARDFIVDLIKREAFLYAGVRKIVQGVSWTAPNPFPTLKFDELGYGSNKFKQLQRNYFDQEEVNRVKSQLTKRKRAAFTAVAMNMKAGKKDSRSMGHCMQTLVINRTPKVTTVELQYRSTEAILKFGGDICYLPWVFNQLEIEPSTVRFHFANAFISGVYFPTLFTTWNPISYLELLWAHDRKLFAGGTRFLLRSAYKRDQHFPYSPENLQHRFLWERVGPPTIKRIKDYLEEKHKLFGKPLPKLHHKKDGSYIPRGKRKHTGDDE